LGRHVPAQYQIYDPLTVRPDPANPNRFIRSPFVNKIIPANRIVNPLSVERAGDKAPCGSGMGSLAMFARKIADTTQKMKLAM
jgi:hypothetical protein